MAWLSLSSFSFLHYLDPRSDVGVGNAPSQVWNSLPIGGMRK